MAATRTPAPLSRRDSAAADGADAEMDPDIVRAGGGIALEEHQQRVVSRGARAAPTTRPRGAISAGAGDAPHEARSANRPVGDGPGRDREQVAAGPPGNPVAAAASGVISS